MDFDDSAMFGIGENTAAPLNTRLLIKIVSEGGKKNFKIWWTEYWKWILIFLL